MTGAVKPPGGGAGPLDAIEANEALGSAEATQPEQVDPSTQGAAATGTADWIARADAGEITPEQAVDGIVADALNSPGVEGLVPSQRQELESVLRTALLEDPTLSTLLARSSSGT